MTLFSIPQDIQIHQDLHKSHSRQSPMGLEAEATPSKMADGLTMKYVRVKISDVLDTWFRSWDSQQAQTKELSRTRRYSEIGKAKFYTCCGLKCEQTALQVGRVFQQLFSSRDFLIWCLGDRFGEADSKRREKKYLLKKTQWYISFQKRKMGRFKWIEIICYNNSTSRVGFA